MSILVACMIQFVGIIIELTAHEWVQFSVGRIIAYLAVGLVENAVPSYSAEIAPSSLRGAFSGSLMCIVTLGNIWGAGMGRAMTSYTNNAAWLIPVGVQLIPAAILLIGLPFTVGKQTMLLKFAREIFYLESPRWLLEQENNELALRNLNRLRPSGQVEDRSTEAELDAMSCTQESDLAGADGTWLELFRGNYRRRVIIASLLFWFQQTTGGQFVISYAPTFFKDMGLGNKSFTYSLLTQVAGFVGALISCLVTDRVGRRPLLISGMFLATLFNFLIAGLGSKAEISTPETNMVIAALILLSASIKYSASTLAYLIAAEIGAIAVATAVDVIAAIVITISIPYLLGTPGANLKAGVGWVLGGNSGLALLFAILFVPELKGRSLDEVDELFKANLWAWQFKDYRTSTSMRQTAPHSEKTVENKVILYKA
ncbi:general substrate transporter [Penicillium angulare]|uniref:general substrate transporter n=1 Tax=Penicillium angulare TaxID=116970 RepID=UPI0025420263|nr:general substrate transporter [Penicillium angulare]KAJ5263518.1 general substrate transporter [Penicillium angulare]